MRSAAGPRGRPSAGIHATPWDTRAQWLPLPLGLSRAELVASCVPSSGRGSVLSQSLCRWNELSPLCLLGAVTQLKFFFLSILSGDQHSLGWGHLIFLSPNFPIFKAGDSRVPAGLEHSILQVSAVTLTVTCPGSITFTGLDVEGHSWPGSTPAAFLRDMDVKTRGHSSSCVRGTIAR